jgi:hypothetical protein
MSENDERIRGLADLESPVSAGFLSVFRRKVYRRAATAQLAHFSFSLPLAIFMEFLNILVHLCSVVDGKKGRSK